MNEKFCISILISLKLIPKGPIDSKSALVRVMAYHRTGDKLLLSTNADTVLWSICVAPGGD